VWLAKALPQNRDLFMTGGGNGGFNLYKYHYPAARTKQAKDQKPMGVSSLKGFKVSKESTEFAYWSIGGMCDSEHSPGVFPSVFDIAALPTLYRTGARDSRAPQLSGHFNAAYC